MDNYKERVNTLLLVATLIATVTFAAGFTVPGGYNSSDRDLGMATMLRDKGFHVFIFCDTIAMYSSIIVAVTLIWAQLGDINLALNAFAGDCSKYDVHGFHSRGIPSSQQTPMACYGCPSHGHYVPCHYVHHHPSIVHVT